MCHNRTPRRITQGPGGVPDGRPLCLSLGGLDGGLATDSTAGGGGTGGDTGRGPGPTCTLTATGDKDRDLAVGAVVHSKQDGSGGAGMA